MAKVRYSAVAQQDLKEIWRYIADDSIVAADNIINKFKSKTINLVEYPEMGVARPELGAGYRVYPVDNYNIYYRYSHDVVAVVRILRCSQDIGKIFL